MYAVLTLIKLGVLPATRSSLDVCRINFYLNFFWSDLSSNVWIYAVLTLIQTTAESVFRRHGLDICRINSYSNSAKKRFVLDGFGYMPYWPLFKLSSTEGGEPQVWIYAVLTLIQTLSRIPWRTCSLDICRINSYSNCDGPWWRSSEFGYMPY